MSQTIRVGIIAASSCVPQVELHIGISRLREAGFETVVHEQCASQCFTFAGSDEDRAAALWEMSTDESIDVIWCARGGYGATRLLPILDELTKKNSPPQRKLLIGYS